MLKQGYDAHQLSCLNGALKEAGVRGDDLEG
jgi:hypothetical protein